MACSVKLQHGAKWRTGVKIQEVAGQDCLDQRAGFGWMLSQLVNSSAWQSSLFAHVQGRASVHYCFPSATSKAGFFLLRLMGCRVGRGQVICVGSNVPVSNSTCDQRPRRKSDEP